MVAAQLDAQQIQRLTDYAREYESWSRTPKGRANTKEHRDHEHYFKERLSPASLEIMSAGDFKEVYKTLWASNMWGNKDWYIDNKLLAPNGLEVIKQALNKLLYGPGEIDIRYDEFRKNVKGFGPSSVSEILHFTFPERFCLWNEKPKSVLPFLNLNLLPDRFFKYQIANGKEYAQCVDALGAVKDSLSDYGIQDFIDLDMLIWHIYDDVMPAEAYKKDRAIKAKPSPKPVQISDHDGAEYYLLELGRMLGYLTYVAARDQGKLFNGHRLGDVAVHKEIPPFAGDRDLNSAREIDVIWFGDDEAPKYCFEVEHTMDIVRSLNRLAQLQYIYARFFIVAPQERMTKFQTEMQKYPYRRMHDRYRFISYDQLASLLELASPFYELRAKVLGEQ